MLRLSFNFHLVFLASACSHALIFCRAVLPVRAGLFEPGVPAPGIDALPLSFGASPPVNHSPLSVLCRCVSSRVAFDHTAVQPVRAGSIGDRYPRIRRLRLPPFDLVVVQCRPFFVLA